MSTMTNPQPDEEAVRPESAAASPESVATKPEFAATNLESTAASLEKTAASLEKTETSLETTATSLETTETSLETTATKPESTADRPESATAKRRKALRKLLWFALSVLAFVLVYFGLEAYMDYGARVTLAITLAVIVLWVLEPIPFSMTAVLVLFLLPISGAVSTDLILSGFASPAIFLIVAGMMIASGVEQTPLGKRLAYQLLYWFGEKKGGVLAGIILVPQVMAFFIPAAAVRTAMLLPIVFSITSILGVKAGDVRGKKLMMGVVIGCGISGTAVLPAALGNVITVDLINTYLQTHVTYTDWLVLALPMWLIMIPASWWVLYRSFPVKEPMPSGLKEKMKELIAELGPVSSREKRLMGILAGVCVLWALEGVHGWPPVIPALIGAVLMAWPGIKVADWEKILDVKFAPLVMLGVTLSLGRALYETGVTGYLSKWMESDLTLYLFSNPALAVLTVAVLTQLIHKVTSNVSTAVIATVPVVMALAAHSPDSPALLLAFVAGLTSLYGFILVVETIPGVMVHGTGWVTQQDFFVPGFWLTLVTTGLTFLMALTWWKWLGYY
ncbi:DASS family sodium-coupled anion symporter [Brevibacillus borstelensis]|uniref:Sodium-dependent dicarboxylate transporter SdcS n=1 Tax=Brevibacillus borstelensis AK1 TaxID=1300222 RepID=M8ECJ3_9BACL|nr:DASS family sodium-coupled anion symporter [Brevibacillus borstelensis]EMT53200.1 anion transporter [Brevibacillus borstelensis AK1]MCC0563622.1 DASS family sodium-coupled anion symporter [Brevibacillus borstelensis]MED1744106.1 DASS family sodium-coupled anion symporter [Brevibacillus borstelensis]